MGHLMQLCESTNASGEMARSVTLGRRYDDYGGYRRQGRRASERCDLAKLAGCIGYLDVEPGSRTWELSLIIGDTRHFLLRSRRSQLPLSELFALSGVRYW